MRAHVAAIHGLGDIVPGMPTNFMTTLEVQGRRGVGDIVPGAQTGFMTTLEVKGRRGVSGLNCGSGCDCGPCRAQYGMGQIDLSLTGTGIVSSIEGALNTTGWPNIPNWVFYAGGIAIVFAMYTSSKGGRRR